ncbi:hypothetical protein AMATHDRAFT_4442 [Amanita thiersii Skay4041]|uniref:Uncharacterized protein n=1 Tax=Amanita thiersii Skay4041 TaxID=703135 RepID=A0A2A9NQH6_9AGAR|nr:hypothetical protein AMATHDRAFT_4442 [Amanita thiersii Skay4041]
MQTNIHITEYAPPVLRAASPASSVGTVYGEDQTSIADLELSDAALARKYEDLLELHKPRKEEEEANQCPLLERPEPGSQQEKELHDKVIANLRLQVREVEENDIFEQTLLRGSQVARVQPPSTDDIDKLMRSMMGTNVQSTSKFGHGGGNPTAASLSPGPWLKRDVPPSTP